MIGVGANDALGGTGMGSDGEDPPFLAAVAFATFAAFAAAAFAAFAALATFAA